MIALHQDISPCINLPDFRLDGAIHGTGHHPVLSQLQLPPVPVRSCFKMAPVYKFALIQMQPKVSQSSASSFQTDIVSLVFTAVEAHVKASSTMA